MQVAKDAIELIARHEEKPVESPAGGLFFAFFLALAANFTAARLGFFKIVKRTQEPLKLRHLVAAFAIYFGLSILLPLALALWGFIAHGNLLYVETLSEKAKLLVQLLLVSLITIGEVLYLVSLKPALRQTIFSSLASFKEELRSMRIGACSWLVAYPTTLFTSLLIALLTFLLLGKYGVEQSAVKELRALLATPSLFVLAAFFVVIIIPFVEEFLFRGILLRYLASRLGLWKALALSSAIFAILHFSRSQGLGNVQLLTSLFVLGCYLGWVYLRQATLLASFALHATFNFVTILLLLFNDS